MSLREFRTSPEFTAVSGTGEWTVTWTSRTTVDLRWVASASPADAHGSRFTSVTTAGNGHAFYVDVPYEEFMALWMEARRQ